MTIKQKLLLNFSLVALIIAACSVFGIWSIRKINSNLEYVTSRAWLAANAAMQTSLDNLTRIVASEQYLKGDRQQARLLIQRAEERFHSKFEQLRNTQLADEKLLSNIRELRNKLTKLEARTISNYYLKSRTKLQLEENALLWTKTLERLRYRLSLTKGSDPKKSQDAENVLVSIGLLSLAERAAVNNYLSGTVREGEATDMREGFRSNLKRRILELSKNPVVPSPDIKAIGTLNSESERLIEKLLTSNRNYLKEQSELSLDTLRLVEAFETIKEGMNANMEKAAITGRLVAQSSQQYFAIFAMLGFLLSILVGFAITRLITYPIHTLTRATQAIAKGDLKHRVAITTKDEIGELSASFNSMADDIHRYTEEIRKKSLQAEMANQELLVTNKELYEALGELERQSEILKETNKELENATRLKSQFLANMSHELRTPMNSIIGFTKLVLRKAEQTLETKQKENLQKVLISAEQLLGLINGILDLSKIEAGRMEMYVEAFLIGDLVNLLRENLSPLLAEKRLKFTTKIDPSLPRIYSDAEKVKQILVNLLSNAIKFTEKGEITLTIHRILTTLNNRPSTDCMEILVHDTGIGIAPDAQIIIFDDFRQADESATRKYGGTGLGLSICKKLCNLLGGSIALMESKPLKGSTFRVVLPIDYEIEKGLGRDSSQRQGSNEPKKVRPTKILAVDDHFDAIEGLRKNLSEHNTQILTTSNSSLGYQTALQELPDLILLDVSINNNSGWDLIAKLKTDPSTVHIPILVLAFDENNTISSPLRVKDYLVKPFDQEMLVSTLSQHGLNKPGRVLLIDADPQIQELAKKNMSQIGIELQCAQDGAQARRFLQDSPGPDLVMLDLASSEQRDSESLMDLTETIQSRDIPIFALISRNLSEKELASLSHQIRKMAQANGHNLKDLVALVAKLLKTQPHPLQP